MPLPKRPPSGVQMHCLEERCGMDGRIFRGRYVWPGVAQRNGFAIFLRYRESSVRVIDNSIGLAKLDGQSSGFDPRGGFITEGLSSGVENQFHVQSPARCCVFGKEALPYSRYNFL